MSASSDRTSSRTVLLVAAAAAAEFNTVSDSRSSGAMRPTGRLIAPYCSSLLSYILHSSKITWSKNFQNEPHRKGCHLPLGDPDPPSTSYMVPCVHPSLHPKLHIDRLIRFSTTHSYVQQTDRSTDHEPRPRTSVAISRIFVLRARDVA